MIRRPPRSTLFPYTRSSDLWLGAPTFFHCCGGFRKYRWSFIAHSQERVAAGGGGGYPIRAESDRKSTRLNSSHPSNPFARSCLKKKNICTPGTKHINLKFAQ